MLKPLDKNTDYVLQLNTRNILTGFNEKISFFYYQGGVGQTQPESLFIIKK